MAGLNDKDEDDSITLPDRPSSGQALIGDSSFASIRRVDLRQLRQFLILAEELHFGRAARRLGIAQPPLSQTIKRLEQEVGTGLFERSKRRVEMTPAGEVFMTQITAALRQIDSAMRIARRVADGEFDRLRVGFITAALFDALPRTMRSFRADYPNISVELDECSSQRQADKLRSGELDVGFLYPRPELLNGLSSMPVERSGMIAALPEAWPLAQRNSVELRELAGCPFILLSQKDHPQLHLGVQAACEAAGFAPVVAQEASQTQTMLSLVGAGFGVALVVESAAKSGQAGVRFVPITDLPATLTVEMVLAWNPVVPSRTKDRLLGMLA